MGTWCTNERARGPTRRRRAGRRGHAGRRGSARGCVAGGAAGPELRPVGRRGHRPRRRAHRPRRGAAPPPVGPRRPGGGGSSAGAVGGPAADAAAPPDPGRRPDHRARARAAHRRPPAPPLRAGPAHDRSPDAAGRPDDGLPARPRRAAGGLGDRDHAVPRRVHVDARRLLRRGGVLRRLRVPDHHAAGRGAGAFRADLVAQLLGPAGPPAAPCARGPPRHRRHRHPDRRHRQPGLDAAARLPVVDLLPQQLGPDPRRRPVLGGRPAAAAAPVDARDRGAVLPRVAAGVRRPRQVRAQDRRPGARRPGGGVDGAVVRHPRRRDRARWAGGSTAPTGSTSATCRRSPARRPCCSGRRRRSCGGRGAPPAGSDRRSGPASADASTSPGACCWAPSPACRRRRSSPRATSTSGCSG